MPKPILKKNAVKFSQANLEKFSSRTPTVIASESVRDHEFEPTESARGSKKTIIRSNEVRQRAEFIEIFLEDFSAEGPLDQTEDLEPGPEPVPVTEEHTSIDPEQLQELKEEWDEVWQKKLEAAVESAREEGIQQGIEASKKEVEDQRALLKQEFKQDLKQLQETWDNYIKRSETILLKIALEITQFIIGVPFPVHYSDITERVLNETLDQLSRDTPVTLSLNPLDLLRMQESGVMELIKDQFTNLRWDPQPTLKEGNWIIQTPRQAIRRITEELLENLKSQFGIVEQAQPEIETATTLPGFDIEYIPPVTNIAVSTTQIPLQVEDEQLQNIDFSPATSTASSFPLSDIDLQHLSEKGSE